ALLRPSSQIVLFCARSDRHQIDLTNSVQCTVCSLREPARAVWNGTLDADCAAEASGEELLDDGVLPEPLNSALYKLQWVWLIQHVINISANTNRDAFKRS